MNFCRREKLFVFFAMCAVALICGEYAITRPTSNALFLTVFSLKGYPWVWLATVPLNLLILIIYNRLLSQLGPLKTLIIFAFLVITINGLLGLFYSRFPYLVFFQYAWKDVYILLMLKQLWSVIQSTIPATRAKYLYGTIYGMGTIGSIGGSLVPSLLAVEIGSEHLFFFTLPIYITVIFAYRALFKRSEVNEDSFKTDVIQTPRAKEGFSLIRKSPILISILLLVICMQASVGLIEYQFNAHLENHIIDKDLRTSYCGQISGWVNSASLILQFVGGFLMIKMIGLKKSHFLIPSLLLISAVNFWIFPSFALLSFSYVFLKAIDFSLFGVIREMLYIPLHMDEKFRAKAVIDVFAYRTSKAFISIGLLILQATFTSYLLPVISIFSIFIFLGWIALVTAFFRKETLVIEPQK